MREQNKRYRDKPESKEKKRIYKQDWRKKQKDNLSFKLHSNLRKRLWKILTYRRESSSLSILGCSLTFYSIWISFTFDGNMSHDNYGKIWNIDHVIGINNYNLNEESNVKTAFHWSNTRACYCSENFSKKDKNDDIYINNHKIQYEQFINIYNFKQQLTKILSAMDNPQPSFFRKEEEGSTTM